MDMDRSSALAALPDGSRRSSELDRKSLGPLGDTSDVDSEAARQAPADAPAGHAVTRMDNLFKVFGQRGKGIWGIWISIGLISYAYGLAGVLVYNFLAFATSYFGQHAVLGTINVAVYVVGGVGQPFIAKLADTTSRPMAYLFSLLCYIIGFTVVATARNVYSVAGGQVMYNVGSTGMDLMNSLIVADMTPLQWRGLATAALSIPWIINAYITGYIVDGLGTDGWRWGFGMFAIIMPVVTAPLLSLLFYAEIKAKHMQKCEDIAHNRAKKPQTDIRQKLKNIASEIDAFGLLLLGTSWSLIFLPFTLSASANNGYKNPSLIAMFVVGGVVFAAFIAYERCVAAHPVVPARILNKTFISCVIISVLYDLSGGLQLTYWSSWVYVATDWTLFQWTIYNNTLTVTLCLFGVLAGLLLRWTHNFKWVLVAGVAVRIIPSGLYVLTTTNRSNVVMAFIPILLGLGGGFSVVASQVAVQASVPHVDMAAAMANMTLWAKLGTAVGSAIAAAVWTERMPLNLAQRLTPLGVTAEQIKEIYGSIIIAKDSEPVVREGVIAAYNTTVRPLYIAGLILSIIPLVSALMVDDYYLGKTQNAVDDKVHPMYAGGSVEGSEAVPSAARSA